MNSYILHLETATKVCSVALSLNGVQIACKESTSDEYIHGEQLTNFVSDVLLMAKISIKNLSAVSVSSGPGSYTGLRIGVSTAKGMCFGLSIPLIAVPSLVSLISIAEKKYQCFLKEDTYLPMMYMPDAIQATIELMEAPKENIKARTAYNISGMSFSPKEIAAEIKKYIPDFSVTYQPDYRQAIADSWPQSIDDAEARNDWGWKEAYNLERMTKDMLVNIAPTQFLK